MGEKLTEEEEKLLAEFENERRSARENLDTEIRDEVKNELTEEVKEVMEREAQGGIEQEVEEKLKTYAGIKKQAEEDIRKKIEEETKEKIRKETEEKIRREIEERERAKKEELLQKIQNLKKIEEEKEMWAEEIKKEARKEAEKSFSADSGEAQKETEEEMRVRMKKELLREIEEERKRKKEELLKKLSGDKKEAPAGKPGISQDENVIILQLFEESQRMMSVFLAKRLKQKEVDSIFKATLAAAVEKFPGILRKSVYDFRGELTKTGELNTSRVISNVKALPAPPEKRPEMMFEALRFIFAERVRKMEAKTSGDIKKQIMGEVTDKMKKSIERKGYGPKIVSIFIKRIIPAGSA